MTAELLASLLDALAGEHAAVYGYGLVAGVVSGAGRRDALAALDTHRARRDQLRAMIAAVGGQPVEAAPAYRAVAQPGDRTAAAVLAGEIEKDVARRFGRLVAASTGDAREFAARAVADAAVRQARWSHSTPRFPGLDSDPTTPPSVAGGHNG